MFEEAFPYYLAMGMSYEQFWEQDSELVKYYRKANEIRQEMINHEAWLHGMYIYEAIADISPILHAFAKRGTKPRKYSEKPYEFRRPEKKKPMSKVDREAQAKSEKIKARMLEAMHNINRQHVEKRMAEKLAAIGAAENDTKVTVVGENLREGT